MYGQLNELRETIMNKVTENKDLLKFIFYCNTTMTDDILLLPNLTKTQIKSLINTQIFKYKRMPLKDQVDAKCFLSMQYTQIYRHKDNYWIMPCFEFIVVCPDSISETLNGNRILAIESCIADTFDMKDIGAIGYVKVDTSQTETVDTGFGSRKIPIRFVDWIKR